MRTDHLLAVINYALQQAKDSGINPLDFGPNQNDLQDPADVIPQLEEMHKQIQWLFDSGSGEVAVMDKSHYRHLWRVYDESN